MKPLSHKHLGLINRTLAAILFTVVLLTVPDLIKSQTEDVHQNLASHQHANLTISVNGEERPLPGLIGIDRQLWKDHHFDMYSANPRSISPVHTHDFGGLIHIEPVLLREFTIGNFLDIWGLDKTKITQAIVNGNRTDNYEGHPLRDNDELRLELNVDTNTDNFTNLTDSESGATIGYPSAWLINKTSEQPTDFRSAVGEEFLSKIDFVPPESKYLMSPRLNIETDALPSNNVTLDEYTIAKLPMVLEGNQSKIRHLERNILYDLNGNPARAILLSTDSFTEYGYFNTEKTLQIWTIKNDKIYIISFTVLLYDEIGEYSYYRPILERILKSFTAL